MIKGDIHLLPYSVQTEFKTHMIRDLPHHASHYVPSISTYLPIDVQ